MFTKKLIIGIFLLTALNSCAQNVTLLGPAYTFVSTGSVANASLSYGSEKAITKLTGKSTGQNIKEILKLNKDDTESNKKN
jgi:hypothetical protein|tara:strand:- start:458 stop:700 length:243 start_codon:yes stop_codon:yes gene_type:complete